MTSQPEIMIPLVSTVEEFTTLKAQLVSTIQDLENAMEDKVRSHNVVPIGLQSNMLLAFLS
jgi:phosphoenolpyruvate-protein kinase (PTS system EI component)